MYKGPFVIDPPKIGPFDRCLVCFTPKSDQQICMTCGHISGYREITEKLQSGIVCTLHAAVPQATGRVRRRGNGECRRRVTSCVN
jgi:hypothetical protein